MEILQQLAPTKSSKCSELQLPRLNRTNSNNLRRPTCEIKKMTDALNRNFIIWIVDLTKVV